MDLPILTLNEGVLLPRSTLRSKVTSKRNVNALKYILSHYNVLNDIAIGIAPFRPTDNPDEDDANLDRADQLEGRIITSALMVQIEGKSWPTPSYTITVRGQERVKVVSVVQDVPFIKATVKTLLAKKSIDDKVTLPPEVLELLKEFQEKTLEILNAVEPDSFPLVDRLQKYLRSTPPEQLVDIMAAALKGSFEEKIKILNAINLEDRIKAAMPLLDKQLKISQIGSIKKRGKVAKPAARFKSDSGETQTFDNGNEDLSSIEEKLRNAKLPEHAMKIVKKELARLKKMTPVFSEYGMLRQYLEILVDLPWSKETVDTLDIANARMELDRDHYGMKDVKKRILEFLAVKKLKSELKGPILCFIGPPGVGKTSIGMSIANILGRKFERISLGGVSDQSDIRGHRRTYVGSMPGRIIQGLLRAGTRNPVFLLDEIDKMSQGSQGIPSAALLEVLDPEQNSKFLDHYINIPFDLSQVIFIATGNTMHTISGPLRDRMEVINVPGYAIEDKIPIVREHILPKQLGLHGLEMNKIRLDNKALKFLVTKYTLEAGVRSLERQIGAICRSVALSVVEQESKDAIKIAEEDIVTILGPPKYAASIHDRLNHPGVSVGLAWTGHGGEVMVVEAAKSPGRGQIRLTGSLGSVIKESANIALTWIRSNGDKISLAGNTLDDWDIHLHFPAGAIGKDGPSAGVAILTALVSLLTNKIVEKGLAMTGEITLRGIVLPVGGIREKVLAAYREGFFGLILPKGNKKDIHDLPNYVKEKMNIEFATTVEDVLSRAFSDLSIVSPTLSPISKL